MQRHGHDCVRAGVAADMLVQKRGKQFAKRAGEIAAQWAELDATAYAATKRSLRGPDIDRVLAGLG